MSIEEIFHRFIENIQHTSLPEYIAVVAGIASVYFSRIENIWVYPVGLINTIIYIYLSFKYHLPGEASVNFYYTVMSFYGWYQWVRKDERHEKILHVTFSDRQMWINQLLFGTGCYIALYMAISLAKDLFYEGAIPWADAFASATAFTAMWLMTRKKVESWYWWIATNIASIPLYFVKGLMLTSVYYLVLLIFAFWGLNEWKRRARFKK